MGLKERKESLGAFEHQEDVYFQERRADIEFVVDRLMRNLLGADQPNLIRWLRQYCDERSFASRHG